MLIFTSLYDLFISYQTCCVLVRGDLAKKKSYKSFSTDLRIKSPFGRAEKSHHDNFDVSENEKNDAKVILPANIVISDISQNNRD